MSNLLERMNARVAITSGCNFSCPYCDGPSRGLDDLGAMEDFRLQPLREGVISITDYIDILRQLKRVGFMGVSFTGGEPLLNHDLPDIVVEAKRLGFKRVEINTNGSMLDRRLKSDEWRRAFSLVSRVKVSVDTLDADTFRSLSGGKGELNVVLDGITSLVELIGKDSVRINRVVLRETLDEIPNFLRFWQSKVGSVNLLELVFVPVVSVETGKLLASSVLDADFFRKNHVDADEIRILLQEIFNGNLYEWGERRGSGFILNGENEDSVLKIIVGDNEGEGTWRVDECKSCPMYCQEGIFTVYVATDGSMSLCRDKTGLLENASLRAGSLEKLPDLVRTIKRARHDLNSFERFKNKWEL